MSIFDFYHFLSFVSLCTITCFAHISLNSCLFDFFLLPTCRSRFPVSFYCTRILASFHAHTRCAHLCSISVSTIQYAVDRMLVSGVLQVDCLQSTLSLCTSQLSLLCIVLVQKCQRRKVEDVDCWRELNMSGELDVVLINRTLECRCICQDRAI